MQYIQKIKLVNFKRFKDLEIQFSKGVNTIIGDNEAGKSSILQAIELVSSGNKNKVESIGIESLLNKEVVQNFFSTSMHFDDLPILHIELYLNDASTLEIVGRHHSSGGDQAGLHMICEPNDEYIKEINQVVADGNNNFPFEYYIVRFITFSGEAYTGYRRFLKSLTIDSSLINSDYANREYTKSVYNSAVELGDRIKLSNEYRQHKASFKNNNLKGINDTLGSYDFSVRTGSKFNLETDLSLNQDNIPISERGKGLQCFIKTEFALTKSDKSDSLDVILLEEPENHLSHTNMKKLISKIADSHKKQIIIATHSSLISTRLDLRKSILLNSLNDKPLRLSELPKSTAKFFMKAPDNNILEFILSKNVILVEGDAEYILLGKLYSAVTSSDHEKDNIHIISVGGTSFKRYIDLAKSLNIKVAVIRDNDKDYQSTCIENYDKYTSDNVKVFFDKDNSRYTFEVCIYHDNKEICDKLFSGGGIKKQPLEFMLDNKAEAAFRLLDKHSCELSSPKYIQEAIEWIRK